HFAALAVMFAIPAAWAIPFIHSTTTQVAMDKWSVQYTGRLKGVDFKFFSWIQNIPRSLIYFVPWVLLFPFARFSKFPDESQRRLARAMGRGIAVPFVAVNLIPGAVARYSMPAIVPGSWLLAMICTGNALQWPRSWMSNDRDWTKVVGAFVALGLAIGTIGYPLTARHGSCMAAKARPTSQNNGAEPGQMAHADASIYCGRRTDAG